MTIIFAILAALAIIALGVVARKYRLLKLDHNWLKEDLHLEEKRHKKTKLQKSFLEREIGVLRDSNRSSLKVWQSERQRLWAQARSAERHSRDLQEFHLNNEFNLQRELAGAHALIELLMVAVPKGGVMTQTHEVRRIFRPVVELDQHRPTTTTNPHVF